MFVQANQQQMYPSGSYSAYPYAQAAPAAYPQYHATATTTQQPMPQTEYPQWQQPQTFQKQPQVMIPSGLSIPPRNQTYDQAVESPTLSSAFLSPVLVTAPSSNGSNSTEHSASTSTLSLTSNFSNSPTHHGISSPSTMIPFLQQNGHHVVCSPSPVVSLDHGNLQSAWVAPSNFIQSAPMAWVASPTNFVQPMFHPPAGMMPVQQSQVAPHQPQRPRFFQQKPSSHHQTQPTNGALGFSTNNRPARKNVRVRCKACASSSCRNSATKELEAADIAECMADRTELMEQLPEFFGEPQLNFEEFVHYAPVFRAKHVGGEEMYYFKIPRTTKERELNIPQRLTELFIRTFGPENAPAKKAFDRISPHTRLCDVRMVVRSTVVKALAPVFTPWLQTMGDAQELFDIIFRYAGVSCVKDVCPNAPQIWCATVEDESTEEDEGWENIGVVSLFNYHLFRRRIAIE